MEIGSQIPLFHEDWANVARAVLPCFPLLEPGEHITFEEYRNRLRTGDIELRKLGTSVKRITAEDYRHGSREKLKEVNRRLRRYVWGRAWEHCPDVAEEISTKNERQRKTQAEYFSRQGRRRY